MLLKHIKSSSPLTAYNDGPLALPENELNRAVFIGTPIPMDILENDAPGLCGDIDSISTNGQEARCC